MIHLSLREYVRLDGEGCRYVLYIPMYVAREKMRAVRPRARRGDARLARPLVFVFDRHHYLQTTQFGWRILF